MREVAEKLDGGGIVGKGSVHFALKGSKAPFLALMPNPRPPFAAAVRDALEARRLIGDAVAPAVKAVLGHAGDAQVLDAVVLWVKVHVVNRVVRPCSIVDAPRYAVSKKASVKDLPAAIPPARAARLPYGRAPSVALVPRRSKALPLGIAVCGECKGGACPPPEFAAGRAILKE